MGHSKSTSRVHRGEERAISRGVRSACDFCHTKRIKCKTEKGSLHCQQCIYRNRVCHFSQKGKTGPKPKPATSGSSSPSSTCIVWGAKRSPRVSTTPDVRGDSRASYHGSNLTESGQGAARPSKATTRQALREWVFLATYNSTVGQLLPFVTEEELDRALQERQAEPELAAAARGPSLSGFRQAEICAAISLGALVSNDQASFSYHLSLQFHLGTAMEKAIPEAAPALSMMALYWQCNGSDKEKDACMHYARAMLEGSESKIRPELALCIEHLDWQNETKVHPEVLDIRQPSCRALSLISYTLASMSTILNASYGKPAAATLAMDLSAVIKSLEADVSEKGDGDLGRVLLRRSYTQLLCDCQQVLPLR